MGKKKNGFTLIELLAVIVILAIIAMIATPIVLGIIDDSRKNAFRESCKRIVSVAEDSFSVTLINGTTPTQTTYTYTDGEEARTAGNITVEFSGTKPQNGSIVIGIDGKVAIALHDGKWCVKKAAASETVTVTETTSAACTLP